MSSLKLMGHVNTGKLVHRRHTSHLALLILLVIVGIFIFATQTLASAAQQTVGHSEVIGAIVPGPAPTVGATITVPDDGSETTDSQSTVSGTCANSSLVIIYDNGANAGSAMCSVAGVFSLSIQLFNGQNALQALNYDSLNQVGPVTATVTITSNQPAEVTSVSGEVIAPIIATAQPQPLAGLANPIIIPSVSPTTRNCDTFDDSRIEKTTTFRISVVCLYRYMDTFSPYQLGLYLQGGTAPYAVSIDWGTSKVANKLVSLNTSGYHVIAFAYPLSGIFTVEIHANDFNGLSSSTQTVAEVNGISSPGVIATIKKDILNTSWFETPVPFYLIAVTLLFGFWIGDLFDRKFGLKKKQHSAF